MATGQEAELGHVQAPSRYTQAIKPVLQAYHQGSPGWGQGCRVPCEEYMGVGCKLPPSQHHKAQLPSLPHPLPSPVFPTLASYLSSLSQT